MRLVWLHGWFSWSVRTIILNTNSDAQTESKRNEQIKKVGTQLHWDHRTINNVHARAPVCVCVCCANEREENAIKSTRRRRLRRRLQQHVVVRTTKAPMHLSLPSQIARTNAGELCDDFLFIWTEFNRRRAATARETHLEATGREWW